jgi:hypothetical protein
MSVLRSAMPPAPLQRPPPRLLWCRSYIVCFSEPLDVGAGSRLSNPACQYLSKE